MASMVSWPTPGQSKINSVITAPASSDPSCNPSTVTTGSSVEGVDAIPLPTTAREVDGQVELRLLPPPARKAQQGDDGEDRDARDDGRQRLVRPETEPHCDREEEVRQLVTAM